VHVVSVGYLVGALHGDLVWATLPEDHPGSLKVAAQEAGHVYPASEASRPGLCPRLLPAQCERPKPLFQ